MRSTPSFRSLALAWVIAAGAAAPAVALDITGYQLIQSNTLKTFTFPSTTTVNPGGYVIVGRNASQSSFESYWGVTLATNVVYINAANNFPKIDGGERFVLRNAGGAGIDGPTPSSIDPVNRSVQRKSAVSNGTLSASWYVVTSSAATPGTGGAGTNSGKVVINEYADAGSFSYEFVELFYDAALSDVPPVLLAIPDQIVTVSNRLQFSVFATPTDGDPVTLSVSNAPAGSTFDSTNENGTFIWTNAAPLGVYTARVYAADNDGADWKAVKISVLTPPTVKFHTSELIVSEEVGTQVVGVVLSRAGDVTVQVSVAGTAMSNDYGVVSTTLIFTAGGATQMDVSVIITNDALTEGVETVILTITNAIGALIGVPLQFTLSIRDNDAISIMTANLTSGSPAVYRDPGQRILRGLKPDICALQEWSVTNAGGIRGFVDLNFGTNFYYYIEPQATNFFPQPNGLVSRWPILAAGEWSDTETVNRDFVWATVDIPGDRNLHVIVVHLYYSGGPDAREREARALTNYIAQAGFPANDYVVLCGDLNTITYGEPCYQVLTNVFSDSRQPKDQFGDIDTSRNRDQRFDYVLPMPLLNSNHYTVTVSGSNFSEGLVFDTRLWTNGTPPPSPVLVTDSAATGNAHMAVMKAFSLGRTPPSLRAIGEQHVIARQPLQFSVSATPTDGDVVTLTASNLPGDATFSATNAVGTFAWTNPAPAGIYTSLFYAADVDGVEQEVVTIHVLVDGAVWINEVHYDNASTDTNEGVEVAGRAGVDLSFYSLCAYNGGDGTLYESNALGGTIDDEGCGYGAVWVPMPGLQNGPDGIALVQHGTDVVEFLSYEGVVTAVEGPAIEWSSTDIGVAEGGAKIGQSLQLIGTGTNSPEFGWAGETNAASPGVLNARQTIFPCIGVTNVPPTLYYIGNRGVVQSNTLSFTVSAWDSDGDPITLSVSNAPAGSSFFPTNANGSFVWTNSAPAGVYTTSFYAVDKDGASFETIWITVGTGTEKPVFQTVGNKTVIQNLALAFDVTATDAEGDPITLTASNLPGSATFSSTNGAGSFLWTLATPVGVYTTRFYASDVDGIAVATSKITVAAATNPPVLQAIGGRWVSESNTISFAVTATDVDQEPITLSVSNAPAGSAFASTNGSGTFTWTNASPTGVYTCAFWASGDDGANSAVVTIRVVVAGAVWVNELHYDNVGTDVSEGVEVAGRAGSDLSVYAIYRYGSNGAVGASTALTGFVDDEGCGFGAVWVPISGLQNGPADGLALVRGGSEVIELLSYEGVLIATNGPAAGMVSLDIKVAEDGTTPTNRSLQLTGYGSGEYDFRWAGPTNAASPGTLNGPLQQIYPCGGDTNAPPKVYWIGDRAVRESNTLSFLVWATNYDNDITTLSVSNAPAGATLYATNEHGSFVWPAPTPVGVYTMTFWAADADGLDSAAVVVDVQMWATNRPILQRIGARAIALSNTLTFSVVGTDPDGDQITLTASNLPAGAVFSATGGNGTFSWTNAAPVGAYTSGFWAVDNDGAVSEVVTITVVAASASLWINELHYDNNSTDTNEGVEVAGVAGTALGGYTLFGYNGGDSKLYSSNALSGTIPDEGCGYGAVWFAISGLQNGAPDGVALVHNGAEVVQFLSYEGVFTASNGPASGMLSVDMGVSESGTEPVGRSLQLQGSGSTYAQFTWTGSTNSASTNSLNANQFIAPCDTDGDGLPNGWESAYFNGPTNATATDDTDTDGMNNWAEYVAGTVPTNDLSLFTADAFRRTGSNRVEFASVTNRVYSLYLRTNLLLGSWTVVQTNIPGNGQTLSLTITNELPALYYRPKVSLP